MIDIKGERDKELISLGVPWLPPIFAKQSLCFLVKPEAENQARGPEPVHNV